jgi:hypothetical protein
VRLKTPDSLAVYFHAHCSVKGARHIADFSTSNSGFIFEIASDTLYVLMLSEVGV